MRLAFLYILFAGIAMAANFGVQAAWAWLFPNLFEPWLSLAAGTGVGLVVKYVLDKRFIFQADHLRQTSQVARSFGLYSLSGGLLTILSWGVELGFMRAFPGWPAARYVGGAIGFALGYLIKYRLDRRFAFSLRLHMSTPDFHAVIFGAASAIATETVRAMLTEKTKASLLLVGRDPAKLEAVANDLRARKAEVRTAVADFMDPATDWKSLLQGQVDVILVAHGELTDQDGCLAAGKKFADTVTVNFTSSATIAGVAAEYLAAQGHGTLAVIGSVAGDRGRQSNFLYGSTKAALDTFLEGLRHLHAARKGVRIVTIKPGLIDTPMTAGMKKGPLCTPAPAAGQLVWKAIKKGGPVAYIPGWWRLIMTIIRAVPRVVFYRTKL